MLSLTGRQIADLAAFAGLTITDTDLDDETVMDSQYSIITGDEAWCMDDEGHRVQYEAIAYCADCPEEGAVGLGPAVTPNADAHNARERAMRIALLPSVSVRMLMQRYGMSRATAYRWVTDWYAARGLPPPWDTPSSNAALSGTGTTK